MSLPRTSAQLRGSAHSVNANSSTARSATIMHHFCRTPATAISDLRARRGPSDPCRADRQLLCRLAVYRTLLWVHADLRRRRHRPPLDGEAERHAREFGCHSAMLDTFSFQGPISIRSSATRFSARLDYPPDHQRLLPQEALDRRKLDERGRSTACWRSWRGCAIPSAAARGTGAEFRDHRALYDRGGL